MTLLFCHDMSDFAQVRAELWQGLGYNVVVCKTAQESLEYVRKKGARSEAEIAIIHKDMGEKGKEQWRASDIISLLQKVSPNTRIGLISGEFPDGTKTARELEADFYFPTALEPNNTWLIKQLNAGWVSPRELDKRGKEIAMPSPSSSREVFF